MNETAVVILNWNGVEYLQKFLPTLLENTPRDNVSVIVADNGSDDGSIRWLKSNHPQVRIINLNENHGFAEGYNLAVKEIESELLVFVNSDIEVTDGWLEPLVNTLRNAPDVAAVQPKIMSYHRRDYFEHAGAAGGFIDRHGYPFCRGRVFSHTEKDIGQYDQITEVSWTSGACMAIKRSLFLKAGGFDGSFFAHMEEIDLCWRLKGMGLKLLFVPQSTVFHVGGATLTYDSPFKVYLNFRNSLFMLYKNLPGRSLHFKMFIRMVLDGVAALQFLFRGKGKLFGAVFRSHIDFWKSRKELKERRGFTRKLFLSEKDSMLMNRSILFRFYIRGYRTFSDIIR